MSKIKVLSIRQPYAHLIVNGVKPIENRTRRTHYRGLLYIHAGKNRDIAAYAKLKDQGVSMPPLADMPAGGIVGHVELKECVSEHDSEWFTGPFGYVLENPRPLEFIALPGRLGIFKESSEVLCRNTK